MSECEEISCSLAVSLRVCVGISLCGRLPCCTAVSSLTLTHSRLLVLFPLLSVFFPPFFPFRDRSRSSFRGTALFAPHKLPLETSIFAGCALSKSDRSTKLFLIPIHSRTFYSSGNHEIGPFGSTGVSYCSDFSTAPASRCDKKDLTLNAEAAHLFNAHSDQQAFWTCCIRNLVGQDGHKPRQDAAGQTRDDANFQINPHGAERGAP